MNEEEIKEYLKRTDKLLDKLSGEDKDTLEWLIFGYNQCAKMLYEKENIIKEVREDLYQAVKWCTENKHNENTIERYLVVDYGKTVGKINEIRTKLDKENI